jgi:hypothetical protein
VRFDAEGTVLVTAGDDGTLRLWPLGHRTEQAGFGRLLGEITTTTPGADGRPETR